jgi:type II secretory pathway pseudopilin PulG
MKNRKIGYNLVEVILALGVCAIGVVSIMALFPIGSSAARDASMETYAANVADEMLQFVKYRLHEVDPNDSASVAQAKVNARWLQIIGTDITPPGPGAADIKTYDESTFLETDPAKLDSKTEWEVPSGTDSLFGGNFDRNESIFQLNGNTRIYQLIVHHNESGVKFGDVNEADSTQDFAMNVDFRAIAYLWKEKIVIDQSSATFPLEVPYDNGARLIMRVTWPAELPLAARQRADYVLEVFKPIVH